MELIKLLGILIVIIGFALKLDSILIILVASIVTAYVGDLGVIGLLETLGSSFVDNRNMAIFILIMLVTGTLERNGLKSAAANLIGRFKKASSGMVIGLYGIMRGIFAAFNVSFGGVAGFVRRSEEHTSELQSRFDLVCRLLLEKKNNKNFLS